MTFTWTPPQADDQSTHNPTVGHFTNDDWTPGEAAIHAFVAGVSDYPRMRPNADWPRYGFNQPLYVSALTAQEVLDWLMTPPGLVRPRARVGRIWFHAAPTATETPLGADLSAGRYAPADLDTLENGMLEWYGALEEAALGSSAFFFFSGHGISYGLDGQLLLPSDWPDPRKRDAAPNRAPRTSFLAKSIGCLPLDEAHFYVDACWSNGVPWAPPFAYDGLEILPQPKSEGQQHPTQKRCLVHAAATGHPTYQPTDPADGISFFGRALVDALKDPGGTPARTDDCEGSLCPVRFPDFVTDVKGRFNKLVKDAQKPITPLADSGWMTSEANVVWRPKTAVPSAAPASGLEPEDARLSQHHEYIYRRDGDPYQLELRLGHESVTWPTVGMRFFDLTSGAERDLDYEVRLIRHDDTHAEVRYDLEIFGTGDEALWVLFADPVDASDARACLLPVAPRRTFQVLHSVGDESSRINFLDVRLSMDNSPPLREIAERWITSRDRSLAGGFGEEEAVQLVRRVERKGTSGSDGRLAAAMAASLLLATQFSRIPTAWLANLAGTYWTPDGATLHAIRLLQETIPVDLVKETLGDVDAPFTEAAAAAQGRLAERRPRVMSTTAAKNVLRRTARIQPGSLFATYAGPVTQLGPWLANPRLLSRRNAYDFLDRYRYERPATTATTGPIARVPVPDWVADLGRGSVATYQVLNAAADESGYVPKFTRAQLADSAEIAASTASRAIGRLVDYGGLVEDGGQYRVTQPVTVSNQVRNAVTF